MKLADVMPTLRLHNTSDLWNHVVSKWTPEQIQEFEMLRDGKVKSIEKIPLKDRKVKTGLRVMRISDGKIYDSVKLCREENQLYSDLMLKKLKLGIEFKRI